MGGGRQTRGLEIDYYSEVLNLSKVPLSKGCKKKLFLGRTGFSLVDVSSVGRRKQGETESEVGNRRQSQSSSPNEY